MVVENVLNRIYKKSKILFLDFDGVLHVDRDPEGNFSKLPQLEKCLTELPDINVVISSSWRESRSLEQLKELFSINLRDRVIGLTPILECGFDSGGRQREIECYLESAPVHSFNASWIALDDTAVFFDEGCPNLILVDATRGFAKKEARSLVAWYEGMTP